MSEVIKCDWCGKTSRRDALVNWFEVSHFGMSVRTTAEADDPRHFCSRECIGAWGSDKELVGSTHADSPDVDA